VPAPVGGEMTMDFHLELPRSSAAAGRARAAIADWFRGDVEDELLRSAQLAVSELTTNAYLHGRGTIVLRGDLDDDRLLVEVIDDGGGFERELRERDFEGLGGRGLAIVDAEVSRWGIHEGTTHVWFELERPGPRLGREEKPSA